MAALATYVVTDRGTVLVQLPDDSEHGFSIRDDDQRWPGGHGLGCAWTAIAATDPRITADDRERLQWLLDEAA